MLEAGKCRHRGKLKRALTMREQRASQGVGAGGAKALRQNSFGNHTQPQQDQRKRVQDKRSRQREQSHRSKSLGAGLRRSPGQLEGWGEEKGTADLRPPQALAACLPAGSHALGPARPALWLLSSPVRGPLCPAWTWSWWGVATACRW